MWETMGATCDTAHLTVQRDLEAIRREEECVEGQTTSGLLGHYERNTTLRAAAMATHDIRCQVCGLIFAERYGELGEGLIELRNLKPVPACAGKVRVDPRADMAVVCPNCPTPTPPGQNVTSARTPSPANAHRPRPRLDSAEPK